MGPWSRSSITLAQPSVRSACSSSWRASARSRRRPVSSAARRMVVPGREGKGIHNIGARMSLIGVGLGARRRRASESRDEKKTTNNIASLVFVARRTGEELCATNKEGRRPARRRVAAELHASVCGISPTRKGCSRSRAATGIPSVWPEQGVARSHARSHACAWRAFNGKEACE